MPKSNDEFFQEEEQQAQEELNKIKIGEAEYDPKEIESYIEKGKKVDEYQKKYNTDFDRAWSSYGKTTQENKQLKEELDQIKQQFQSRQHEGPGELTEEQIQLAREQARKIGLFTQGDLDQWYQSKRAADKLLEECKTFESEITGEDGRPKFVSEDVLRYMAETGIKSPIKAYKDKFENELDQWKQSELLKAKTTDSMPTLSTQSSKQPRQVAVTKDNIGQMIREQLWGSEKGDQ